jgi:ubiquinone/menaquinone biosynthesis C-methylase UbiE
MSIFFLNSRMLDIRKSWDRMAKLYQMNYPIDSDTIHYGPLCHGENKLNLLGDISRLRAIDLGCGAGHNVIALAKAGAIAAGVDFSLKQLEEARKMTKDMKLAADFFQSDITSMSFFNNETFDLAISACAIAFVKNLDRALAEIFRILKENGRFILSVMHPVQYIIDGDEGSMYFNSAYPFKSRVLKWSWNIREKSIPFQHYLRSISDYHNALVKAGFEVTRILEPEPTMDSPHKGISKEIMEDYPYIAKHLPVTLIMMACKNPSPRIGEADGQK